MNRLLSNGGTTDEQGMEGGDKIRPTVTVGPTSQSLGANK